MGFADNSSRLSFFCFLLLQIFPHPLGSIVALVVVDRSYDLAAPSGNPLFYVHRGRPSGLLRPYDENDPVTSFEEGKSQVRNRGRRGVDQDQAEPLSQPLPQPIIMGHIEEGEDGVGLWGKGAYGEIPLFRLAECLIERFRLNAELFQMILERGIGVASLNEDPGSRSRRSTDSSTFVAAASAR